MNIYSKDKLALNRLESFSEKDLNKKKKDIKKILTEQTRTMIVAGASGGVVGTISDSISKSIKYSAKLAVKGAKGIVKHPRLVRI